jgi:hypothetical protein
MEVLDIWEGISHGLSRRQPGNTDPSFLRPIFQIRRDLLDAKSVFEIEDLRT